MSLQILVVEDEPKVERFIKKALEQSGFQVTAINTLEDVESHLKHISFDVLVLDRLVGKRDSLTLLSRLKRAAPQTKILILSALGELSDRVTGLDLGADDYLAKPFHVSELVARVTSLSRRTIAAPAENVLRFHDLEIFLDSQTVKRGLNSVRLTAKEFKILCILAKKPNRVFSKTELLDLAWDVNADPESNVVEVTMNRLRTKVDEDSASPLIHTRRGSGYWLGDANGD